MGAQKEPKTFEQLEPHGEIADSDGVLLFRGGTGRRGSVAALLAPANQRLDALEQEELIKGEWDMTGATTIPYADPARDVGMETIDPQSVEISRFRIVAGGVPVYNGMAYMHHQSSDRVVTNTGDLREAWTELPDFGADNNAINVILMVYADEAMTGQDLLDAFFQDPAAEQREMYYFAWMWSPARTNFTITARSGIGRTAAGDSVSVAALPVGTPLALRMDWATGRPSIFRTDNATDVLPATNCQLQAPAGMRFRPWTFVMTMGTDALASVQAVPIQYNLGNSLASGFIGIGDAELPAGAQGGDAYIVTAPGNYGGKSAEAGDTVVLHPTTAAMHVFKGARGATLAEVAAAGFQTKAEIDATVPPDPAVTYALARREFTQQSAVTNIDGEIPAERPFGEVRIVGVMPAGTVLGNYWPGDLVITGATAFHRYRPLPGERWYYTSLWDIKPVEMIYVGRGQYGSDPMATIVLDNISWSGYVFPYPLWRPRIAVPLATDVELVYKAVSPPADDDKYRVSVLTDMTRLLALADSSPEVEILFVADPESMPLGGTAQGTITVVSQAGIYKRIKVNGGGIGSAISLTPGVEQGNYIWIKPGESLVIRWYMALVGGNTAINFAVDRWNQLEGGLLQLTFTTDRMSIAVDRPVSVIRVTAAEGLLGRQIDLNGFSPSQDQELIIITNNDIGMRLGTNSGYTFDWPIDKKMKKGRAYRFKYDRAENRFNLVSNTDGVMSTIPDEVIVSGSRVLNASDLGKTLVIPAGTAAVQLTCPDDPMFDSGWWCTVICRSANGVSFVGGNGATLESVGDKVALAQFAAAQVRKHGSGVFGLSGMLS